MWYVQQVAKCVNTKRHHTCCKQARQFIEQWRQYIVIVKSAPTAAQVGRDLDPAELEGMDEAKLQQLQNLKESAASIAKDMAQVASTQNKRVAAAQMQISVDNMQQVLNKHQQTNKKQ